MPRIARIPRRTVHLSARRHSQVRADRVGRLLLPCDRPRQMRSWWTTTTSSTCIRRARIRLAPVRRRMGRRVSRSTTRRARSSRRRRPKRPNHCWVAGLQPDTEYTYKVFVKDEAVGEGERWDWSASEQGADAAGRASTTTASARIPIRPCRLRRFTFAVDRRLRRRRQARSTPNAPPAAGRRTRCGARSMTTTCG